MHKYNLYGNTKREKGARQQTMEKNIQISECVIQQITQQTTTFFFLEI